jgi:exoribonuclease-2
MHLGRFIEYIEEGRVVCTLCIQDKGTRLHLLTPLNREVNLASKRALLVSSSSVETQRPREELLERLRQGEAARNRLKTQVDVKGLWELVKEEPDGFEPKYLAELAFGARVGDEHLSALVRALFEDHLYFKMREGRFQPNTEERVQQILMEREEQALKEERLSLGSVWLRATRERKPAEPPPCRDYVIETLKALALYGEEAPQFKEGKELLDRAGVSDIRKAREVLVSLGVWGPDENLDLIRMEIKTEFTEEELDEASRLSTVAIRDQGREDLTGLAVFTVDGPLTRDYDDAVSFEVSNNRVSLGIHIADVSSRILPETLLDRTASGRGASLYLPQQHIPMIPPGLSQDSLSLRQGQDREAISLLATLDLSGNLLEHRLLRSVVRVRENLTYEFVNDALVGDDKLRSLHQLCRKLQENRMAQGALNLSLPELVVRLDSNGSPWLELLPQDTPSRFIIAELMIFYNYMLACFLRDHGVPGLFRTQDEPAERLMANGLDYVFYVFKQRRQLTPIMIDTTPKGHRALGLDAYVHCTSPIRRYLDLVVQRQMACFLAGERPCYDTEGLNEIRMAVEPAIKSIEKIKRARLRYWILKFLKMHSEERFEALVLDEMKTRYRILLKDFLMVAEIRKEKNMAFAAGEAMRVFVKKADPWEDTLELGLAPPAA